MLKKFLFFPSILVCFFIFSGFSGISVEGEGDSIVDYIIRSESVVAVSDGEKVKLNTKVLGLMEDCLDGAIDMPALGVSLDNETRRELKQGVWLEFSFKDKQIFNELPFEKLLLKLEPNAGGVNIIRYNDGLYEGRCFYLNLENNFNPVYEYVVSLYK